MIEFANFIRRDVVKFWLPALVIVFLLPSIGSALPRGTELGVRGGTDTGSQGEHFSAAEVYYLLQLPWQKDLSPTARVYTRFDAGVGYLETNHDSGEWLALGGDLVFSLMEGRWELEVGFRPTWLSEHNFDDTDLGGPFQFASHGGTALNFGRTTLSYRYSHTSNAGSYGTNPGLDLHLFGMGLRF